MNLLQLVNFSLFDKLLFHIKGILMGSIMKKIKYIFTKSYILGKNIFFLVIFLVFRVEVIRKANNINEW